jgi:hypothetical protein
LIGILGEPGFQRPVLDGLWFMPAPLSMTVRFAARDLESVGEVHVRNGQPAFFDFSGCRFGAGFFEWSRYLETNGLRFVGCEFEGEVWVAANGYCVLDSCVIRGPVIVGDQDCELTVRRSQFQGHGSGAAVSQRTSSIQAATIDSCVIERFQAGIILDTETQVVVRNSVIRDCAGYGMYLIANVAQIEDNRVERCGGEGIHSASNRLVEQRNRVSGCAQLGSAYGGIVAFVLADDAYIAENVVWANGANGMVVGVKYTIGTVEVTNNTSVGNARAGILSDDAVDTLYYQPHKYVVKNNIAAFNGTYGIQWLDPFATSVGCNDWFGNGAAAVQGSLPSDEDLSLDPLFCDVTQDNVHLSAGSPLLNAAGCGQIGALGQGCDAPIIARLTTFAVVPTIEGIEVRWQVADAAPGFVSWIERAEASAGPWAKVECERASDGEVTVEYDRTTAPARSYWYRLVATDRGLTRALAEPIQVETAPPTRFALLGTGPNPSPGTVEATFQLAHAADITLEMFDALGRRVATLASGPWPAGIHHANWAGARPASGVYLVRYRHPGGEDLRRIAIVR